MALKLMTEDVVRERASAAALLVPLMCRMSDVNWAM